MPPRPARKPTGGPAAPRRPAGKTEKIPPRPQGAGEAAKAVEVPVPVKEQSKGVVVQERAARGCDSSVNGSGAGDSQWDASKPFMVQFGSINPGLMNGMQIPARTSSAPPNLDEQKKDQVRRESFRAVPAMPIPSVPNVQPHQPRKDVGSANLSSIETSQAPTQLKRDVNVPNPSGPVGAPPKPANVLPPLAAMPTTIPFQHQQPQAPLQFGGPNPQIHPQGLAANSLQIPMALPVGSAPQVTQQIFIPSHHHMLQQQAMIHQGQGLGFLPPGHQLAPQLGSLGMGIVPQFPQHQPNKLSGARKTTVKITHPDTHEELRLDKRTDSFKDATSSVQRSMPNAPVQSPHVAAAYPPSTQYYAAAQPNSYNASQLVFPTLHVPVSSGQMPTGSQAPRYPHPVSQTGKAGPHMVHGAEAVNLGGPSVSTPAPNSVQVMVKLPPTSQVEKGRSSVIISKPISKVETPRPLKVAADAAVSHQRNESVGEPIENASIPVAAGGFVPVPQGNEGNRREPVRRSDSFKDNQKKSIKKDNKHLLHSHQSDANNFADNAEAFSTKTIKDTKVGDGNLQEPSSNCESERPQVASTLATSTSLSSQEVHRGSSPDTGLSRTVDIEQGHEKAVSSTGILLQKEKLDAPQVSTHEPNFGTDGVSVRETEESGALVSSGHLMARTVQNKFVAGVIQENSHFNSVGVVDAARNENVGVPKELPQDLASAKEPLVSLNDSSENASILTLVEQNDDALELAGKAEQYENVVKKELRNSMPGASIADQKDRKARDHISDKPMVGTESATSSCASCASSVKNENLPDNLESGHEVSLSEDNVASVSVMTSLDFAPESKLSQVTQKVEDNVVLSGGVSSTTSSAPKEKPTLENLKPKITAVKKKKKIKEILSKADAAGTTDLYNAYKGPEEKYEVVTVSESTNSSLQTGEIDVAVVDFTKGVVTSQQDGQNKSELDDWEDAADVSTPRLRATDHEQPINANLMEHTEDGDEVTGRKKYSKDFLLTLSHQFTGLPQGFEIGSDIANGLMSVPIAKQHVIDLDYVSPGMIIDRPGAPRVDRRSVSNMDDDKWIRSQPIGAGRDPRLDVGYGVAVSLRPGQGANHGILRNQRGHSSNQLIGGILSGPQTGVPQGGMSRSNSDADRWQKVTVGQRGLIPSPQGPMQVMHKAEKKYEIGKISDEESAKQRQLKAILNKLTPQNFEKLFAQVIEVNIDNPVTLTGVISQIFDKALMEPTFCEMYANFCFHLSDAIPDFVEGTEKITFKRLLLNKCQEEFERGEREQAEANRVEEEGEIKQSEEEREEKRIQARRRMLGNIRLIGELYKKKMLTERIMHECIQKLLGQGENPDEEDIEALCKLMSTIGEIIDHPKAKEHMDVYFEQMMRLSTSQKLSPRVRFLLRDTIDLRKNRWQQRIKVEGPKKIDEVHRDAAQERHGQGSRTMRGPVIGSIPRRGPVIEYGLRGSNPLTSPGFQQVAGIRGMPAQIRSYAQDVHFDDRQQFDNRSLTLPQRSIGDDSITLGPRGGLARGMSIRGQSLMPNVPTAETLGVRDYRRMSPGQNGYNPLLDSSSFNSREPRMLERTFDRSASIPPLSGWAHVASGSNNFSTSEVKMSEDRLQEKSMLAVKEYYSSMDMQELVLCVQDLNAPSYYPAMISQWVTDSFERKDVERDLLAKLIVNLCKSHENLLGPGQLMQGFEHVLSLLEDAVTDAPKAVEFLGKIFATTIVENVIPFSDVGRLILKGGEEPGQLLESGLAAEVLGSILESIRSEKGESVLDKIRVSSKLRLEDFQQPDGTKSRRLEAFL